MLAKMLLVTLSVLYRGERKSSGLVIGADVVPEGGSE